MELKIYSPAEDGFIQKIDWNFEELKNEIAEKVEHYKNLVYSEDQMKVAKSDRANLRKFVDALETKRKEIKKQCLAPYENFEKQMKTLVAIINEPILMIDTQVKNFENQKKEEKRTNLECFFIGYNSIEWLKFEQIFDEKWLNSSLKSEKAIEEIQVKVEQIKKDLVTLQNLPDFSFDAVEEYKHSLDVNKAVSEGIRLSEMQKRKAEFEKGKEELPFEVDRSNDKVENPSVLPPDERGKQWITFKALLSTEDALALRDFFKSRNIEYTKA